MRLAPEGDGAGAAVAALDVQAALVDEGGHGIAEPTGRPRRPGEPIRLPAVLEQPVVLEVREGDGVGVLDVDVEPPIQLGEPSVVSVADTASSRLESPSTSDSSW